MPSYPFPVGEDEAQVRWWDGMNPTEQKRWFRLVAAMTPDERRAFHAERRGIAERFDLAGDSGWRSFQAVRADEHADRLYRRWADAVNARRAA